MWQISIEFSKLIFVDKMYATAGAVYIYQRVPKIKCTAMQPSSKIYCNYGECTMKTSPIICFSQSRDRR